MMWYPLYIKNPDPDKRRCIWVVYRALSWYGGVLVPPDKCGDANLYCKCVVPRTSISLVCVPTLWEWWRRGTCISSLIMGRVRVAAQKSNVSYVASFVGRREVDDHRKPDSAKTLNQQIV